MGRRKSQPTFGKGKKEGQSGGLKGGTETSPATPKPPPKKDPRVKKPGVGTGNGGGATGPKRTPDQLLLDRLEMVQLLRRGWSKKMIAEKFGVHPTQISHDWKVVLGDLREASEDALEEMVAAQVERYAAVAREALEAWEKSKLDARKAVEETDGERRVCAVCEGSGRVFAKSGGNGGAQGAGGNGGGGGGKAGGGKTCFYCGGEGSREPRKKTTTTVEGQCGDSRYLQTAISAYNRICELKALNPSKKVDLGGNVGLDWSIFAAAVPESVPDLVGEEIARARERAASAIGGEAGRDDE